jgi:hypothetical protein
MKPVARIPRELVQRKPKHGEPCTQCGICCMVAKCDLGKHLFGHAPGACPALRWHDGKSSCGVVEESPTKDMREAALLLTRAGQGCDCRINGEPVNHAFNARLDALDLEQKQAWEKARKQWLMPP